MKRKLLSGALLLGSIIAANAQSSCVDALDLPVGLTTVDEISGEAVSVAATSACWNAPNATAANWYKVTPQTNGVYRLSTDLPQNVGGDTRVSVFSGTCDALSCWAASDDVYYGATDAESNFLTDFEFPVLGGTTYYVVFDNKWNPGGFDVELSFIDSTCETTDTFSESWSPIKNYWFCWARIDNNQDSNGFSLDTEYDFGGQNNNYRDNVVSISSYEADLDDFLVSNARALEAGTEYVLSVTYNALNITDADNAVVGPANESFEAVIINSANSYDILGEETGITQVGETQADILNNAVTKTYNFTPDTAGNYRLGVHSTSATGGGLSLFVNISLSLAASSSQNAQSAFSVYPNPTNTVVNVANAKAQINAVSLVDINGRTVKSVQFDGVSSAQVNIADLANGVYMMNIKSDKGTVTKKVVKN